MPEENKCYKCGNACENGMAFDVMRVSMAKTGSSRSELKAGQKLEGFETHRICDACIDEKLRRIEKPMSGFIEKFRITVFALIAGVGLMIANRGEVRGTAFIVGALLAAFFVLKFIRFISAAIKKKQNFAKFSENNARFVAAWECLSEVAPRKDKWDRGVFFIPVTKATYGMKASDFVTYYRLSEENAKIFARLLQKREGNHEDQ